MTTETLRNADLNLMVERLRDQRARTLDVVVPAGQIKVRDAQVHLSGLEGILDADGVSDPNGAYTLTNIALEGVAEKLDIPLRFLRDIYTESSRVFDVNVKHRLWMRRQTDAAAGKSYLLRLLRDTGTIPGSGPVGVVRAFLSANYKAIDSLDCLLAVLGGIKEAGVVDPEFTCDLTERRMYLTVVAPQIAAEAPGLLARYRSPFTGQLGRDNPIVQAGIRVTNSETGDGAYTIAPFMRILVCRNGQTVTKDMIRKTHLGARLDDGVVEASPETVRRNLALVSSQTTDAVSKFLTPGYLAGVIAALEEKAGQPVEHAPKVIQVVSKQLGFTQDQADGILSMFVKGADPTVGGVMQAVTAHAQNLTDADQASALEDKAIAALEAAYAAVS